MFILLVCNAGMSTSLIVNQMKKCIREQGKDYEIKAVEMCIRDRFKPVNRPKPACGVDSFAILRQPVRIPFSNASFVFRAALNIPLKKSAISS